MASAENRKMEARFLAASLFLFGILSFFVIQEYFYYIVGGLLLVFAFFPLHRRIQRVFKRPGVAAFLSFLIVVIVIVGPLALIVVLVFQDAVDFARDYSPRKIADMVQPVFDRLHIGDPVAPRDGNTTANTTGEPGSIAMWVGNSLTNFAKRIGDELVAAAGGLAVGLVVTGFVLFYGFAEGPAFYSWFRHVLPLPDEIEESLFSEIRKVTRVVFVGNILIALVGGVIGGVTFLIFGVPNAVFWGFVMFIFGILPVLGAPMIWAPAGLWLIIQDRPIAGIAVLAVNGLLVAGYIDNILRPRVMGRAANVHPILILVGVLGGVEIFGALGFVIGPLVLAVFIAIIRSYTEWHPRWKERRTLGIERYHPSAEIELDLGKTTEKGPLVSGEPITEGSNVPIDDGSRKG